MISYVRKITKRGVCLFGSYFWNNAMAEFKDEKVEVEYADNNFSKVLVKLPNGQVITVEKED